mmetsp:Transcript_16288/g.46372  ORF Transcript_16288/g.46372 Transcript_16288/m.46372 type:complete len:299 (+) Transcript_16288:1304-2200(+)
MMFALASCTSFWATNRCSRSVHCLDNFANSTWHWVRRDWSLARSAVKEPRFESVEFFASCARIAKNFLASATDACASPSTWAISSHVARACSWLMSPSLLSENLVIVFASFCTAASTAATFSPDICICVFRLRSAVSFFNSASLVAPPSSRFCSAAISLAEASAGLFDNSFMSTNFCTTSVRAFVTAFWAAAAASSQAATAAMASRGARLSRPLRNGSSASFALATAASAFSTWRVASATISVHSSRSFCSLDEVTTMASFLSAAEIFARIAVNSSRRNPVALLSFTSTSFAVADSFV